MLREIQESTEHYVSGNPGNKEAAVYDKLNNFSARYLAFRDLGPWLKLVKGKTALDFGSGVGTSAAFLLENGFDIRGVDISPEMVHTAKKAFPVIDFQVIELNSFPFAHKTFDLVFSCFVLFELNSRENIKKYAENARNALKDDGYFIGITGSVSMHDPKSDSDIIFSKFPENEIATSGSIVKMRYNEINLSFSDYYWTEQDYREAFNEAGLQICDIHYPLGKKEEPYPWKDELRRSPILLILASKKA